MLKTSRQRLFTSFAAIALMALTRYGHFGSALSLPDASLAVFFLAGFYLPAWMLPVLLIEAVGIDYLATTVGGVSACAAGAGGCTPQAGRCLKQRPPATARRC